MEGPSLAPPDYNKPFLLYLHEQKGIACSMLAQKTAQSLRAVAYYSAQLGPVCNSRQDFMH